MGWGRVLNVGSYLTRASPELHRPSYISSPSPTPYDPFALTLAAEASSITAKVGSMHFSIRSARADADRAAHWEELCSRWVRMLSSSSRGVSGTLALPVFWRRNGVWIRKTIAAVTCVESDWTHFAYAPETFHSPGETCLVRLVRQQFMAYLQEVRQDRCGPCQKKAV